MSAHTNNTRLLQLSRVLVILTVVIATSTIRAQTLQMVAEPIYPQGRAHLVYSHLAEYLSDNLGKKILLTIPINFQQHWLFTQRGDTPDIVIEEAPLTDYWVQYRGYTPLVRGKQSTSYSLVTLNSDYKNPDDLVMLPVATLPSPSTDYLILTQWYKNPLWQPEIVSSSTSWDDSVQQLWGGEVEAAIIPTELAKSYPQLRVIKTSVSMPGLSISVAPHIETELYESIESLLLALNDDSDNYHVMHELNITQFIPALKTEYRGYAEWLRVVSKEDFALPIASSSAGMASLH